MEAEIIWPTDEYLNSSHSITLQYHASWKVDVKTGAVTYPSTLKRYEAEDADLSGNAVVKECDDCVSKRAVHQGIYISTETVAKSAPIHKQQALLTLPTPDHSQQRQRGDVPQRDRHGRPAVARAPLPR